MRLRKAVSVLLCCSFDSSRLLRFLLALGRVSSGLCAAFLWFLPRLHVSLSLLLIFAHTAPASVGRGLYCAATLTGSIPVPSPFGFSRASRALTLSMPPRCPTSLRRSGPNHSDLYRLHVERFLCFGVSELPHLHAFACAHLFLLHFTSLGFSVSVSRPGGRHPRSAPFP